MSKLFRYELYNGQITNGIQPLVTFFIAGLYKIFPSDNPYNLIKLYYIFSIFLLLVSFILVYFLGRTIKIHTKNEYIISIMITLWGGSQYIFRHFFNGLETGLYLVLLLLFSIQYIYYLNSSNKKKNFHLFILSCIMGLLILTRIDAIFLSFGVCVYLFYLFLYKKSLIHLFQMLLFGLNSLLISSPWWLYNLFYFNDVLPSSGKLYIFHKITIAYLINNFLISLNMITDSFYVFFYTFDRILNGNMLGLIFFILFKLIFIIGLIILILKKDIKIPNFFKEEYLPIFIFLFFISIYYLLRAHPPVFIQRYMAPFFIPGMLITSTLISLLLCKIKNGFIVKIFTLNFGIILIAYQIFSLFIIHLRKNNYFFLEQTQWILQNVDKTVLIGAGQSGTLGFFHRNIIHLEGKMNHEAIKARKNNKLYDYILKYDIKYLIDTPNFIRFFFDYKSSKNEQYKLIKKNYRFHIYEKK